jgi:hypothetical protein
MGVKVADDFTGTWTANGSKSDRERQDHEEYLAARAAEDPPPTPDADHEPPEHTVTDQEPDAAESETRERRSWEPVDLGPVLEGNWRPPEPSVGLREDGKGMFYPGKCHTVIGETEGGKTWLALCAALHEMQSGNHVLYIDFEDDEGGVAGRLLTLGAGRDLIAKQFHYLRPESPLDGGINLDDLRNLVMTYRPTLDILDGITEAMTMHGLNPLDNKEAALFGRILPRRLAAAGAAVASLDHVTKDREGRGRYAIGAVHKLNALDGGAYILENRHPFGVGRTGRSTVRVAKDRPGQLRRNALPSGNGLHWYGDLVLKSVDEDFAEVTIYPPTERDDNDDRPTGLMLKISKLLADNGELSQRKILSAISGKTDTKRQALDLLIMDGYVSETTPHKVIRPFMEPPK